MKILDLGRGQNKTPGSIGVDTAKVEGVDIIADINFLPFQSLSIDRIYCYNILEHVEDLIKVMEEIHKVLKFGGEVIIEVPHVKSLDAFMDPTHKRFFTIFAMDYFTSESAFNYYSQARFKIVQKLLKFKLNWLEKIFNLRPEFTERLLGIIPVKAHIYWVLKKE